MKFSLSIVSFMSLLAVGCSRKKAVTDTHKELQSPLFTLLPADSTNVHFQNVLKESLNMNVLMYEYLYNGGGVAVGDFNGDYKMDLYFTSNMGDNKFYVNQGNMEFMDTTVESKVGGRNGPWKTGVTAVDINGDDRLDIYLCYSGALPDHKRRNQLFINQGNNGNGIPIFEEKAKEYGLDSPAFSNQGHFFDYDHDGDLDMLLLNHNPKSLPVLNEKSTKRLLKTDNPLIGLRLYRQSKGTFKDVTLSSGINGSSLSYGLGLCISDINNDGWEDFYVSNDYTVPDYLYINNGNGTFSDKLKPSMGHISHFSMGNNIADVNNDGLQDIFTLDMLPEDNLRQKLLLWPDNYEKFDLNVRSGFHHQYMRNMLQLNNGNDTFSEIGQLSGVSNTDWSWAALLADFDNDGWKDLYVTNGYFRDYTNLDFINYMDGHVQSKGRLKREDVLRLIEKMPSTDLANYLYKNKDGIGFKNVTEEMGVQHIANSNGAAYADLDNDGDLDLVVNNINKPAFIYRNESNQKEGANFLQIELKGSGGNKRGLGAKVTIYTKGKQQCLEQITTRGYLSSVSDVLHFGLGGEEKVDSLKIVWNDLTTQVLRDVFANQKLLVNQENASKIEIRKITETNTVFTVTTSPVNYHTNAANRFNDFKRQTLLLSQFSHLGPCLAKGDVNNDGMEDIFVGGVKGQGGGLFLQRANGYFQKRNVSDFENDKGFEDTDAVFFDANSDGNLDIYVTSGGYHDFLPNGKLLQDRLYFGDGRGGFLKRGSVLPQMPTSTATVVIHDINQDSFPDIFVGGRVVPGRYPEPPKSYLLMNDGNGNFKDVTKNMAPQLQNLGMVTDALWSDFDNDNSKELMVVGEWMPLTLFKLRDGKLHEITSNYFGEKYTGWWNTIKEGDFNNDGLTDFVVGNLGTNTQFQVSKNQPAELYFSDFDNNGSVDPVLFYFIEGKSYPGITRDELLGQLAGLRSKFTSYKSYAQATLNDIFDKKTLEKVNKLSVNYAKTALFLNTSEKGFHKMELPVQSQFSQVNAIEILDYNNDGNQDMVLFGNNHHLKLRFARSDANYGMLLKGDGKGNFEYIDQTSSGLNIQGQVDHVLQFNDVLLLSIQGRPPMAYKLSK